MDELLLTGVDVLKANVRVTWCGGSRFQITHLDAIVRGGGADAMKAICRNADILEATLSLNAVPLITDLYPTRLHYEQLVEWYSKFGFKREPIDHPFILNYMVRVPHLLRVIEPVLARV